MNRLAIALAGFAITTSVAAEDINKTLDADADGAIYVSSTAGSVSVTGWSRDQVEITGKLGSGVEELVFERDGDEIFIKVKVQRNNSRNISSDLIINVPEKSSLEIHTVSADIEVDNVHGEQGIESVSGDIETTAHAEDIEIESVSGDVEVAGDGEPIRSRLNTVSGDIDAEEVSGELEAESVSGDIVIASGEFERSFVHTVNGDIVFDAKLLDEGRLEIETINGEVDVNLNGGVDARYDIESFNGNIRNCFGPDPVKASRYTPGLELRFTEGSDSGRVTIQTLNGNISLCK